ncbi:DUF1788 domain-containing protein [Halorussus ruber]|uniref:DUF1788 domain-containing protein n=1 Tax=Halorussus ruber TaxID=1126238 RepID=UPI001092B65F|nr:DUF1788 domain-containing protein [Halorussus ruber]
MSGDTASPYREFKEEILAFAQGRRGIRNPVVVAAVEPAVEHRAGGRLASWASDGSGADGTSAETEEPPSIPDEVTVQPIWLDELLARTDVYNLLVDLGEPLAELEAEDGVSVGQRVERTMQDRLAEELVWEIVTAEVEEAELNEQSHVLLLLDLGSLSPYTRASELLDELDRRSVESTVAALVPVPGDAVGGKGRFFGGDSRHCYPAHQIDGPIRGEHLRR